MTINILNGDCRDVLPTLPSDSFDCVVTSPPYYGLRDYGVDGQIGLEPTLDAYVEQMVGVFDELRRVLKPSGTAWLNIGDSYAANGASNIGRNDAGRNFTGGGGNIEGSGNPGKQGSFERSTGLKPKDLCGVPWRVALALQARGWWLRSAIVWHKPNPMPESTKDRPTSAYEMVFLLTKSANYFYDADAIREENSNPEAAECIKHWSERPGNGEWPSGTGGRMGSVRNGRNARNVWTIAPRPFKGAHFATMPPGLAERCIKAGCPVSGHVLDPFGGAGTTGLVADRLGRHATLIELNPAYAVMADERIHGSAPLLAAQ